MSFPITAYSCARCDFSAVNAEYWGRYEYEIDSQRCSVKRVLGWCYDCNGLRPIEQFGIAEIKDSRQMSPSDYARIKLLSVRQVGDERCLLCGGKKHELFEALADDEDEKEVFYTGFLHPCCGGEIYITYPGIRLMPSSEDVRIYSIFGAFSRLGSAT
jgi:hypothetical protein